jgi:hypothetical protein
MNSTATAWDLSPAESALIAQHQREAPVDVVKLAQAFQVNVWEDALGDDISGKLFRDADSGGESGYSIVVNEPESFRRKRFTVAHELAHFLLHRKEVDSGVQDDVYYRSKLSNAMETQANRLAADILMPYSLIKTLQDAGVKDVMGLANRLEVSVAAMSIRLDIPVV